MTVFVSYMLIALVIVLLGMLALREWTLEYRPPQKVIQEIQTRVSRDISLGKWEEASKVLAPLLDKNLGGTVTILLNMRILRRTKQFSLASEKIAQAVKAYPKNLSFLQEQGKIHLALGKSKEALLCFKKSQSLFRTDEDFLDLATALFQANRIKDSWACIKDLMADTDNHLLFALAGDCLFRMERNEEAINYYRKAQKSGLNNYQVLSRLGHSLRRIGKFREAEYYFRLILKQDSSNVYATLGLGNCLEATKKYPQALAVYQKGDAWDSGHSHILRQAGICAVYTEQYDFAEIYLKDSIKKGAESPQALAFLGYSLEKQQRWEEAEKIYVQLVDKYPQHVAGYRAIAWLYGVGLSYQTTAKTGLKMAQKALKLLPEPASWEMLSACEARAGNFQTAHDIQEQLSSEESNKTIRLRYYHSMRALRKKIPLNEDQVIRALVA